MQTPPSLKLDKNFVGNARQFFKSIDLANLRLAFEFKASTGRLSDDVISLLQDVNIAHIVDLTFEDPQLESYLLYSRVFGESEKNNLIDSKDLLQIKTKVARSKGKVIRLVGHSLRTIEDTRKIKNQIFT